MAEYQDPDYDVDPDDIKNDMVEYVKGVFPDFDPEASHLWDVTSDALSGKISELMEMLVNVPKDIFKAFGGLFNLTPIEAAPATGLTTWTMVDATGYTIPAGTVVEIPNGEEAVAFQTIEDVVVPNGEITTGVGEVSIRALIDGAAGNGLGGPVDQVDLVNYVVDPGGIVVEGVTSQGADAEDSEEFLGRLATRLRLLADRPILPEDFALLASGLGLPSIERVMALDLYDPATDTWDNERTETLVFLNDTGTESDVGDMDAAIAVVEAAREVNFQVFRTSPTHTDMIYNVTVRAYPNYSIPDLEVRVAAALADFNDPNLWGQPGGGEDRLWVNQPEVRYLEAASAVDRVEGVNYIEALTINGVADDFTLPGVAGLPAPDPTINVTVNLP